MNEVIVGVTAGTAASPNYMARKINPAKTVNGIAADENGNVQLNPLHLKVASAVRDGNSATVDFDGTSEKELVIPAGFKRISATNSPYIESIEGLAVLYGNFKPNNYKSEVFSFTNALAFGNVSNGVRYVYIADTRTNTQYRFIFDSAWAFGRYEVITAPLLNESGGFAGGGWTHIDTIDLSSGALSYEIDTTGYSEIIVTNLTALTCSGAYMLWKGGAAHASTMLSTSGASHTIARYIGNGSVVVLKPRSSGDTLMVCAYCSCDDNDNTLKFVFSSVTSGTIYIVGRA